MFVLFSYTLLNEMNHYRMKDEVGDEVSFLYMQFSGVPFGKELFDLF